MVPYQAYLHDQRNSHRWAAYIQDEFPILKNLVLNAGVRFDGYSTFGSTTNPRAALIYHPFEKATAKLIYGTAFRAPNSYELYYEGGGMKKNCSLDPETIQTYEIIWEQFLKDRFRLVGAVFYYRVKDSIRQLVDPSDNLIGFVNAGDVTGRGMELEVEAKWDSGVHARASYSYQDVTDDTTHTWMANSPHHMAKLNMVVPVFQKKSSPVSRRII